MTKQKAMRIIAEVCVAAFYLFVAISVTIAFALWVSPRIVHWFCS